MMSKVSAPKSVSALQLVLAILGWSMTAALFWSLLDASELAAGITVEYFEAWRVAVAAGVLVAIAMTPFAFVVGWIWHRSNMGLRIKKLVWNRPALSGAICTAVIGASIVLSYATFAALEIFRQYFGSEVVHQLGLAISVPILAVLLGLLVVATVAPLRRLFEHLGNPRRMLMTAAAINLILVAAWGITLTRLGAEIWDNISTNSLIPFVLIGLFGILGAIFARRTQTGRITLVIAAVTIFWAGLYMVGDTSQAVRLNMAYGDSGTGFVMSLVDLNTHHGFAAAEANRGQSAVCVPGAEPPQLSDVGRAAEDAPDIIWLTIDAFRWNHTTMAGYQRDTTPNIAEHARRAAVFETAYTPATSTRQTMRALFTGTYPSMIDAPRGPMWALTLPREQHTIAEFLSSAGYQTTAFSSEDNIFSTEDGGMRGFDLVDESPVQDKIDLHYSAPGTIDGMIDQLQSGEGPQFLWSHLIEPHQPYRTGPDPIDFGDDDIDQFDAALHFVDSEVDRLLEFIAHRQRPTYLILSSDHGHAFGEHGNRYHGTTVFEEEVRVPLIFWGPDIIADRYQTPVGVLDIFATTFELAGLQPPGGSCSESLIEVLRTESRPVPRPVYMEQVPDYSRAYFAAALVDKSDKLILQPSFEVTSLYDLQEDPGESRDLAEETPERLQKQLEILYEFWRDRGMDATDYGHHP